LKFEKQFQATLQITLGGWSRSFGGKKYNMIGQIKLMLISIRTDLEKELNILKSVFDKI